MASQNISRQLQTLQFASSSTLPTIDIPRNLDIKGLLVRVTGTVDVTVQPTATRKWWTDILRRIQIVIGGQQNVVDATFTDLAFGNFQRGFVTDIDSAPSVTVADNKAFSASAIIDLQNVDGIRPTDSNLHTKDLSLLQMIIDTGSVTDFWTDGAAHINDAATKIYVSALESIEDAAGQVEPRFVRKVSTQRKEITSANSQFKIPLSRGNLLRAVSVRAISDGVPSETLINKMTFASGVDVRYNLPWRDVKAINRFDYGRNSSDQDGIAVIDLAPDRQLSRTFNLGAVTEADVILDVNSEGTLDEVLLTIYEFIAPQAAKA